ncbi:hypothetical protein B0H19DRAFT_1162026 [Mycena capillaripes]|nr:hypothetical protein B0H19DRAFT_1162026 [Mycena capillaripes]
MRLFRRSLPQPPEETTAGRGEDVFVSCGLRPVASRCDCHLGSTSPSHRHSGSRRRAEARSYGWRVGGSQRARRKGNASGVDARVDCAQLFRDPWWRNFPLVFCASKVRVLSAYFAPCGRRRCITSPTAAYYPSSFAAWPHCSQCSISTVAVTTSPHPFMPPPSSTSHWSLPSASASLHRPSLS